MFCLWQHIVGTINIFINLDMPTQIIINCKVVLISKPVMPILYNSEYNKYNKTEIIAIYVNRIIQKSYLEVYLAFKN